MRGQYNDLHQNGVEVLALAPSRIDEAQRFAATNRIPFPLLADPTLRVFRAYQVESHLLSLGQRPALYAVDCNGIVRYAYLGSQQWQLGSIDEALAALTRDHMTLDGALRRP